MGYKSLLCGQTCFLHIACNSWQSQIWPLNKVGDSQNLPSLKIPKETTPWCVAKIVVTLHPSFFFWSLTWQHVCSCDYSLITLFLVSLFFAFLYSAIFICHIHWLDSAIIVFDDILACFRLWPVVTKFKMVITPRKGQGFEGRMFSGFLPAIEEGFT